MLKIEESEADSTVESEPRPWRKAAMGVSAAFLMLSAFLLIYHAPQSINRSSGLGQSRIEQKNGANFDAMKAINMVGKSFDKYNQAQVVDDVDNFAINMERAAKHQFQALGDDANIFCSFCDAFICIGCDGDDIVKKKMYVKDPWNVFHVHEFCLILGPRGKPFTIQMTNDYAGYGYYGWFKESGSRKNSNLAISFH